MPTKNSPAKPRRAPRVPAFAASEAPVSGPVPLQGADLSEQGSIGLPAPRGAWRVLGFLLALCQPWAGLVLALLYWPSADGRARRFSRWCLALAILGGFLLCLAGAVWTAMQNGESGVQAW